MISDMEYNRLYRNLPKTSKGRASRASFLIKNGRACTRAYDDCFENGDGMQVLALLIEEVRTHPEMRRLMEDQGAWSAVYDQVLISEPLLL